MDKDEIEFLSQPLLTSEGSINEACLNELNKAIINCPKTHERLLGDSEWTVKKWTFVSDITGAFAKYAVKQSPYACPSGIENVIGYLDACLKKQVQWGVGGMAELSLCDISRLLYDILYEQGVSIFDSWNISKNKREDILFVSNCSHVDPDDDYIDLDALLHNVCLDIRGERRAFDKFNKEFDEKYKENKWS